MSDGLLLFLVFLAQTAPPSDLAFNPTHSTQQVLSFFTIDTTLTTVLCCWTVLLVLYPIGRYLVKPWAFRRDRLFGLLAGEAIVYYYKQFRPGSKIGGKPVGDPTLTEQAYMDSFTVDFNTWYGRRYYIAPVCGLAILSLFCAWWTIVTIRLWILGRQDVQSMHGLVAAAIAGAFAWIISDEIDRLRRRDFTSSDVSSVI